MDQAGDEGLAGSVLAEHQHRVVAVGAFCDLFLDRLHPRRGCNQLVGIVVTLDKAGHDLGAVHDVEGV